MPRPSGVRARRATSLLTAVLLATFTLACAGLGAATSPSGIPVTGPSACDLIVAQDPAIFSSYFERVCAEPQFEVAFQMWGFGNFTYGSVSGDGFQDLEYGFYWEAPCSNQSWRALGSHCGEQEYWLGNITEGTVSGPFFVESPPVCACGVALAHSEAAAALPPPYPVIGGLLAGLALGGLAFSRYRRKPRSDVAFRPKRSRFRSMDRADDASDRDERQ
jgi:hypothetical protein